MSVPLPVSTAPSAFPRPAIHRKTSCARWLFCGSLYLVALTGCTASLPPERYGVQTSRGVTVCREYCPPFGGQTIRPPRRMADVTTLWMPLTREENARLAARGSLAAKNLPAASPVSGWLPPSERHVMQEYLYRLTVSQKGLTRRVMARAADFLPMILAELEEQGLPRELAALPLVESAFDPRTVSHAGAAGLWQLMPVTARRFGLIVSASCDERFDPRKSTQAALRYLRWLHSRFREWPLALAAYNCGEGALTALLRGHGADTLASLSISGRDSMPRETLIFVPKFVAAATAMIAGGHLLPEQKTMTDQPVQASLSEDRTNTPLAISPARAGAGAPPAVPAMRRIRR